eukprot:572562-Prorocentrum_minimum.AAC.1
MNVSSLFPNFSSEPLLVPDRRIRLPGSESQPSVTLADLNTCASFSTLQLSRHGASASPSRSACRPVGIPTPRPAPRAGARRISALALRALDADTAESKLRVQRSRRFFTGAACSARAGTSPP